LFHFDDRSYRRRAYDAEMFKLFGITIEKNAIIRQVQRPFSRKKYLSIRMAQSKAGISDSINSEFSTIRQQVNRNLSFDFFVLKIFRRLIDWTIELGNAGSGTRKKIIIFCKTLDLEAYMLPESGRSGVKNVACDTETV